MYGKYILFTSQCIQPPLFHSLAISAFSPCLPSALRFLWPLSACLRCLFALFNHQTNALWHVPIAHRHRCCQQPQKATFNLALLPLPACSHSDGPKKHCICHHLWLMALLIVVLGHYQTYTFCFHHTYSQGLRQNAGGKLCVQQGLKGCVLVKTN